MPVNLRSPPIVISPTDKCSGNVVAIALSPGHLTASPDDLGVSGREVATQIAVVLLVIRRGHQHVHVAADGFGFRISEQALGATIERFDGAVVVDDDDAVDGGIEHGIETLGPGQSLRRGGSVGFLGRAPLMIQPRDHEAGQNKEWQRERVSRIRDGEAVRRQKKVHRRQR